MVEQRDALRRIDPELAALQVLVPTIDIDSPIEARRIDRVIADEIRGSLDFRGVSASNEFVNRPDGSTVPVRVYQSESLGAGPHPVVLFLHGGCFVLGGLYSEDSRCLAYARSTQAIIVAVDYRLAPEHPFPEALHDCQAVLEWIRSDAQHHRFDAERLAIGGISAGGALAAGLALGSRGEPLKLLMLLYAVLDGRANSGSMDEFVDNPVLNSVTVLKLWRAYLGAGWVPGQGDLPSLASPSHATSLRGFPRTFVAIAEFDPLRDDSIAFAERLRGEGVGVDVKFYAGAYHSFDSFSPARMAQQAVADQIDVIQDALAGPIPDR